MKKICFPAGLGALAMVLPGQLAAATFERPIPQPQTDSAEVWYFIASLTLVVALAMVQVMVNRR